MITVYSDDYEEITMDFFKQKKTDPFPHVGCVLSVNGTQYRVIKSSEINHELVCVKIGVADNFKNNN